MNTSVTLTADEFRRLHNGLCELDSMVQKLADNNVHQSQALADILQTLRDSLSGAYAQESRDFDAKNQHYEQVRASLGLSAVWSMYEVGDMDQPHAFQGALQVAYLDHWGDKPVYVQIHGPLWRDLYAAADMAIRDSGDTHHVFVEAFRVNKQQPRQLLLTTGS